MATRIKSRPNRRLRAPTSTSGSGARPSCCGRGASRSWISTNLIEEVEALARAELTAVRGHASVIIEHLLKLEHSPASEPRPGWRASVREHRRRLRRELTPRLRQLLVGELPALYGEVRNDTAALLRDHGETTAADALPAGCPYDLDRLTGAGCPDGLIRST